MQRDGWSVEEVYCYVGEGGRVGAEGEAEVGEAGVINADGGVGVEEGVEREVRWRSRWL